ncbi:hypothetical protein HN51_027785 [Arachis hypogaea]
MVNNSAAFTLCHYNEVTFSFFVPPLSRRTFAQCPPQCHVPTQRGRCRNLESVPIVLPVARLHWLSPTQSVTVPPPSPPFSPNQKRKLKHEALASPPPQRLPPSVAFRHYHRRMVVRVSSSFKNRSFFLELGASVPGLHLLRCAPAAVRCAPAAVRRALRHHRLCLVVVLEVHNPPIAASSSSSASLSLLFVCSAAGPNGYVWWLESLPLLCMLHALYVAVVKAKSLLFSSAAGLLRLLVASLLPYASGSSAG